MTPEGGEKEGRKEGGGRREGKSKGERREGGKIREPGQKLRKYNATEEK
jgi:hypothetical protein